MQEYSDEELLEFSRDEAEYELSDEDFERFNSLKAQKLEEEIDGYKQDKAQENAGGLDEILNSAQDDLTEVVEVFGTEIEVLVDPDDTDVKKIRELQNKADADDLSDEQIDELKDAVFSFMSDFTVNYTEQDWRNSYSDKDVGLMSIVETAYELFDQVEDLVKQKKRR